MRKPDVQTMLDALTANAEAFLRLEEEIRQDAKRYAKAEDGGDLGEFLRYPRTAGRMLRSALALVRVWNARAEYYGQAPAVALEKELENFIAKVDKSAASLKPPKTGKRRGRPPAPAHIKDLLEETIAALAKGYAEDYTRDAAARRVRRDFRKKRLIP